MKHVRTIAAGAFKARCLALLDEVNETGDELVVTKRGRPVARVIPARDDEVPNLRGSVVWEGDLVDPIEVTWTATT